MQSPVIVVGGGIAGLVCAVELHRAGRPVVVLEADDDIGGRVRSSRIAGATIDHGFQVLFTAYPTLREYVDIAALDPRRFQPAARIVRDGRVSRIGDALRDPIGEPGLLFDTVRARAVPVTDKLRLLTLRHFAASLTIDECFSARFANVSTRDFLRARGFGERVIDGFFGPFYGGILLDRSLGTSASILLFTFKMLAEGDTIVPARGMGALPALIASALPRGAVRVGVPVQRLEVQDGAVTGVRLADDTAFEASHVVLATDAFAAIALARTAGLALAPPAGVLGCTTVYYSTSTTPIPGKALWLNANTGATVSHAITLTDVAPEYAASGALIAATALGAAADLSDDALDAAAQRELAMMATAAGVPSARAPLTRLAVWRVPFAQFAQPPGWRDQRPTIACGLRGLWRASETLHSSSLEGAARGGRDAARAILAG